MDVTVRGHAVQISECDANLFASHQWYVRQEKSGRLHVFRKFNRTTQLFTRIAMQAPDGMHVDHINGNTLDNRRENLRICTHQQNQWNRKRSPGISHYKGVTRIRQPNGIRWMARVECNTERHSFGTFKTQLQAALCYDEHAVRLFGEFASPNFPERFKKNVRRQEVA